MNWSWPVFFAAFFGASLPGFILLSFELVRHILWKRKRGR